MTAKGKSRALYKIRQRLEKFFGRGLKACDLDRFFEPLRARLYKTGVSFENALGLPPLDGEWFISILLQGGAMYLKIWGTDHSPAGPNPELKAKVEALRRQFGDIAPLLGGIQIFYGRTPRLSARQHGGEVVENTEAKVCSAAAQAP